MPTVKNIPGPFRLFLTSFDGNGPAHVHVERADMTCKFWLRPLSLVRNHGFSAHELNVIRRLIDTHRRTILEAWHGHGA